MLEHSPDIVCAACVCLHVLRLLKQILDVRAKRLARVEIELNPRLHEIPASANAVPVPLGKQTPFDPMFSENPVRRRNDSVEASERINSHFFFNQCTKCTKRTRKTQKTHRRVERMGDGR